MPLKTIVLAAGPILLVFLQPDIGTALVYIAVLAAVLFVVGLRWPHLALIGTVALLVVLAVLWWLPVRGRQRAQAVPGRAHELHAPDDPTTDSYNLTQSKTAVGAGGLRGRGVAGATQTALDYLPEHATDFAFASLAEQRGFFGASMLLLLYLLVVWRGLKIVTSARDLFGAIVAAGIVFALPLPGVRERRDDDRHRADHGHPASVRLGRRLVDDQQPRRRSASSRRSTPAAAGGARERGKLPMMRSCARAASAARLGRRPAASRSRARASSCRCSRRSCARAARRRRDARGRARRRRGARLGRAGRRRRCCARRRAPDVPIVGVTEGESLPYVLDTEPRPRRARPGLAGARRSPGARQGARPGRRRGSPRACRCCVAPSSTS